MHEALSPAMEKQSQPGRLADYCILRAVGKGSYGEVSLARYRNEGKQFVIKKLHLQNTSSRERKAAEQEAQLLSQLKHPNIVTYRESWEGEDGLLYIVMGFCEGGDLYHRLKDQRGKFLEESQVVEWFVQIAMALQYLHDKHIMHRDLKTQNIFLTRTNIIKVGDLGIARVLENQYDMASTLIGTPYYMSPELFSNKPYNYKSDVWALGCCVYEMATLKHAFNAKDMNSLVFRIIEGKLPAMPKHYNPQLGELIGTMLSKQPEKRPDVKDVLRRPYIKHHISLFLQATKVKSGKSRRRALDSKAICASENAEASEKNVPQKQILEQQKKQKLNKEKNPDKSKHVCTNPAEASTRDSSKNSLKNVLDSAGLSIVTVSRVDIDILPFEQENPEGDRLILDERIQSVITSAEKESKGLPEGMWLKDNQHIRKVASKPEREDFNQTSTKNMEDGDDTMKLLQPVFKDQRSSDQENLDSTEKLLEPFVPVLISDETYSKNSRETEVKSNSALKPHSSLSEPSLSWQRRQRNMEQLEAVAPQRPLPSPPSVHKVAVKKTCSNSDQPATDSSSQIRVSQDRPLSARERRRLKQSQEELLPPVLVARRASHSVAEEAKSLASNHHISTSRSSPNLVYPQKTKLVRHLSDDEFSSSASSTDKSEGDSKEGKVDSNEMQDLVQLMTQTLKQESRDQCDAPRNPFPKSEFKLHRKYRDTLVLHGKAAEDPEDFSFNAISAPQKVRRIIEALRADVVQGLGVKLLERVYDVMDEDDDIKREVDMKEFMGDKYEDYSMKVRQLKLFEDNASF
ncbi:serine/threonine-protein kinase Nek4 isoform X2 [Microcaecilia unicolor]|uniref:Serine/threonine-protein kinase Nek4 n=1 Tax=Microcaecilia unicolor TaxID=1415580 RepID=A0A6P7YGF1_9AMPH|nr:serine/threonine-protein kinase Nek4 isoform X2 [Microcaecilia unicolor]